MWHEERLLIDGQLVEAEGGRTYPTLDPSTGETLGVAADASVGDAQKAVEAARRAFDRTSWSTDVELRKRGLRQLHQALVEKREDLRQIVVSEVGVPVSMTHGPGLDTPIDILEFYIQLLDRYDFQEDLGPVDVRGASHQRWVEKEAVGVVAAIVPYNQPVQITIAKIAPALAAGCTVVVKGPPQTPWITASIGQVIAGCSEIPPGVVNVIISESSGVGEALVSDPDVDMVSFTGSTAAGRHIMASAAATVKKVFLELGGKSALLALDDADFDRVSMTAGFTICSHAGQGCAITSRLLVPQARFDDVVDRVVANLERVQYGDPRDPASMMGPLISGQQRGRVEGLVDAARDAGAKVATGGARPDHLTQGYFYQPTVIVGVDNGSPIAREEVFGPVLVVLPYRDTDDAVEIANDSPFGLSGAVYGADSERATAVARRLRAGTVGINGGSWYAPDAPFGGYKQSGIGREMGVPGLEEYLEMKTLARPA